MIPITPGPVPPSFWPTWETRRLGLLPPFILATEKVHKIHLRTSATIRFISRKILSKLSARHGHGLARIIRGNVQVDVEEISSPRGMTEVLWGQVPVSRHRSQVVGHYGGAHGGP